MRRTKLIPSNHEGGEQTWERQSWHAPLALTNWSVRLVAVAGLLWGRKLKFKAKFEIGSSLCSFKR
jgi:hypothetical protein